MSLEHSPQRQGRGHAAYTIAEFCDAHRISRATYYNIKAAGKGPVEMTVGTRKIISDESAAAWRKAMEAGTGQLHTPEAA